MLQLSGIGERFTDEGRVGEVNKKLKYEVGKVQVQLVSPSRQSLSFLPGRKAPMIATSLEKGLVGRLTNGKGKNE